jgi:hypothetical protein
MRLDLRAKTEDRRLDPPLPIVLARGYGPMGIDLRAKTGVDRLHNDLRNATN